MSCRVLGRNAEYAFLSCVVNDLRMKGFGIIRAEYLPTEKNRQNSGFYEKAGFKAESSTAEGVLFILEANDQVTDVDYIKCKMV
jgi:predicted enzyme involved in methoxymalonyl-ACP biosynthesis